MILNYNYVQFRKAFNELNLSPFIKIQNLMSFLIQLTNDEAQVYDTVIFENENEDCKPMEQKLWPRHCVQKTWGAELHEDLKVTISYISILSAEKGILIILTDQLTFFFLMHVTYEMCSFTVP